MKNNNVIIDLLRKDGSVKCTNCLIRASRYDSTGNIAIIAQCTGESKYMSNDGTEEPCEDGEQWGVLTVNTPSCYGDDYVLVKDYSEGEGNLISLKKAGLIKDPREWVSSGFVQIPVCKLTVAGKMFVSSSLNPDRDEENT